MRNFLNNINIVGGVCVWREGEIIRYCLDSYLSICDTVVIIMDNSDDKTRGIVNEYVQKYFDRIITGESNVPLDILNKYGDKLTVHNRFKKHAKPIVQSLFDLVKLQHEKRPIDIFIKLDSDEMFTDNITSILQKFWQSDRSVVFMTPFAVFDSFYVLANKDMIAHARIFKYRPEITANPYPTRCFFKPYKEERKIMRAVFSYIHLARLTKENRELRKNIRDFPGEWRKAKLWRVSKPAYRLLPEEVQIVFKSDNYLNETEYDGNIDSIPLVF